MLRSSFMCSEKRCSGLRTKNGQKGILTPAEQGQMREREKEITAAEQLYVVVSF